MPPEPLVLAKVRLTCPSVPSQWDCWDEAGQYYYLRYRFGNLTMDSFKSPEVEDWPTNTKLGQLFRWTDPCRQSCYHGYMTLREAVAILGVKVACNADIRTYDWNED